MSQELAHSLYTNIDKSLLFSDEVQAITGYSSAIIRTLYSRKHLELTYTPPTGRGVKAQYAMFDVIEIMAYAEISRLGVHPTFTGAWKDGDPLAIGIANCVLDQIHALSGNTKPRLRALPGKKELEKIPCGSEKYVIIYYDESADGIWAIWAPDAVCDIEYSGVARVIIDCEKLALKALNIFAQYKSRI